MIGGLTGALEGNVRDKFGDAAGEAVKVLSNAGGKVKDVKDLGKAIGL